MSNIQTLYFIAGLFFFVFLFLAIAMYKLKDYDICPSCGGKCKTCDGSGYVRRENDKKHN